MTAKNQTRKERDRRRREDDFFYAAEKLYADRGYFHTSMEDIAKEAEYATGTIYRYFPSKEALYNSILIRKGTAYLESVENSLQGCEGPLERLKSLLRNKIRFFFENAGFVKLYLSQVNGASSTIQPPEELEEAHDAYMGMFAGIFREGMKEGVFVKMDIDLLLLSFMGMTNHMLFIAISEEKNIGEQEIEKFVLGFLKTGLIRQGE